FAVVRNEKGADSSVRIVRAKVAFAPVKSAELAIWTPRFENRSTNRCISQFLRQPKIFRLADMAELGPMLGIMLVQLRPAAKSRSAAKEHQCEQQKTDCESEGTCTHVFHYTATAAMPAISL